MLKRKGGSSGQRRARPFHGRSLPRSLRVVPRGSCYLANVSFEIMNPDEITVTSTNITNVDCYGDNTGELGVFVRLSYEKT